MATNTDATENRVLDLCYQFGGAAEECTEIVDRLDAEVTRLDAENDELRAEINKLREPLMEADRLRQKEEYEKTKSPITEEQIRGYFSLL